MNKWLRQYWLQQADGSWWDGKWSYWRLEYRWIELKWWQKLPVRQNLSTFHRDYTKLQSFWWFCRSRKTRACLLWSSKRWPTSHGPVSILIYCPLSKKTLRRLLRWGIRAYLPLLASGMGYSKDNSWECSRWWSKGCPIWLSLLSAAGFSSIVEPILRILRRLGRRLMPLIEPNLSVRNSENLFLLFHWRGIHG